MTDRADLAAKILVAAEEAGLPSDQGIPGLKAAPQAHQIREYPRSWSLPLYGSLEEINLDIAPLANLGLRNLRVNLGVNDQALWGEDSPRLEIEVWLTWDKAPEEIAPKDREPQDFPVGSLVVYKGAGHFVVGHTTQRVKLDCVEFEDGSRLLVAPSSLRYSTE